MLASLLVLYTRGNGEPQFGDVHDARRQKGLCYTNTEWPIPPRVEDAVSSGDVSEADGEIDGETTATCPPPASISLKLKIQTGITFENGARVRTSMFPERYLI